MDLIILLLLVRTVALLFVLNQRFDDHGRNVNVSTLGKTRQTLFQVRTNALGQIVVTIHAPHNSVNFWTVVFI